MKHILGISICCLLVSSCGRVARNGALLNSHVTEGIIEYQENVELLIKTLADVQRGILNQRWDEIYTAVELEYRNTAGLDERDPLNREQRLDIATIAAAFRDRIYSEITIRENELLSDSRLNAALLVELNETVTQYLNSQEELERARTQMNSRLEEMTGFDFCGITETVSEFMELLPQGD